MLAIVGCDCHNGITMAQGVLRDAGIENWLSVPGYKGREKGLGFIEQLGDVKRLNGEDWLKDFISHHGSYSIVVAYNDMAGAWVDVGRGDAKSKIEAAELAKQFA